MIYLPIKGIPGVCIGIFIGIWILAITDAYMNKIKILTDEEIGFIKRRWIRLFQSGEEDQTQSLKNEIPAIHDLSLQILGILIYFTLRKPLSNTFSAAGAGLDAKDGEIQKT